MQSHRRVTLGIRPEEFERRPATINAQGLAISGQAVLVEPHGSDMFVTIEAPCGEVTARLEPNLGIRVGDHLGLIPLLEGKHLFSIDDGRRL
jgi:ABC-type sugar transport system ATPase subunit